MICQRCLFRATFRTRSQPSLHETSIPRFARALATSPVNSAKAISSARTTTAAPRQGAPDSHQPPAATSTSAAQPFSTPLTPSPAGTDVAARTPSAPATVRSSVPAGTPLKGLNFFKNKTDPVALEDSEYPSWLWGVLKEAKGKEGGEAEGDLFSKSKKQRRIAAKKLRKQALLDPGSLAPKIPLYEQSIDLPAGDGSIDGAMMAGKAREDLTKAMRKKRRSAIKEDNFLRAMR
ncbi:hypothetical protein H2199_001230 [Coniosporium tulheliwenetii]|uniref:Uncharacterized protein n=1 Tax=Coniosporium tulheliwenetii TaxID=3383036 RepID=A0ACC2ZLY1_9PEZI|nr:hypothetical protein H2199_001230 [Cladosporium sp. JES 115]